MIHRLTTLLQGFNLNNTIIIKFQKENMSCLLKLLLKKGHNSDKNIKKSNKMLSLFSTSVPARPKYRGAVPHPRNVAPLCPF